MVKKMLAIACASVMLISSVTFASQGDPNEEVITPVSPSTESTTTVDNTTANATTANTTTERTATINTTTATTGHDQVVNTASLPASVPEEVKNNVEELNQTGGTLNDFESATGDTSSYTTIGDEPSAEEKQQYDLVSDVVGYLNPDGEMTGTPTDPISIDIGADDLSDYMLVITNPEMKQIEYIDLGKENENVKYNEDTGTVEVLPSIYGLVGLFQKTDEQTAE